MTALLAFIRRVVPAWLGLTLLGIGGAVVIVIWGHR